MRPNYLSSIRFYFSKTNNPLCVVLDTVNDPQKVLFFIGHAVSCFDNEDGWHLVYFCCTFSLKAV